MLKIGQFSDTFLPVVDGVGRVVQAYAETLTAMGHQVTVVGLHFLLLSLLKCLITFTKANIKM